MSDTTEARPLYVGLAGMGTVGSGLVRLLQENAVLIRRRTGREIFIRKILVRNINKARTVEIPDGCDLTTNPADLTADPDIDVLVELMGGIDAPRTIIDSALDAGKHIVTANKALLAEDGLELFQKAEEKGLILRYEASVAGAVPVIDGLRGAMSSNRISSVVGILNGTSNYILSAMTDGGLDFTTALRDAQRLGYAEADPTLDIDGHDAAHKLTLLIRMAYGVNYPYSVMPVQGIRGMELRDIRMAREFGYAVKLIAQVRRLNMNEGDDSHIRLDAGVFPALVGSSYLLANVNGVYNAVRIDSPSSGSLFFHGPGAGSLPTASVVLSDLMAVARNEKPNNTGFFGAKIPRAAVVPPEECRSSYYVRVMVADNPGVLRDIAACMADESISMARIIQSNAKDGVVPLVFMTHECSARAMRSALQHAMDARLLTEPAVCYRVL